MRFLTRYEDDEAFVMWYAIRLWPFRMYLRVAVAWGVCAPREINDSRCWGTYAQCDPRWR